MTEEELRVDLDPPTQEHLHLLNRLFLEFCGAFNALEEREHKRADCLAAAKNLAMSIAKIRYADDPDFKGLDLL